VAGTRFTTAPDGVRLAYDVAGAGPPVLFSRGWVTNLAHLQRTPGFSDYLRALARHHAVVRYDGRGNGLSDRDAPSYRLDDLVADLEAVADAAGLDRFDLYGSCYGGPPAIAFAARHPDRVRRLVLEGTFATLLRATPEKELAFVRAALDGLAANPEAIFAAFAYLTSPRSSAPQADNVARMQESIGPEAAVELYSLAFSLDVSDEARAIDSPTLVLQRRGSRAVPFEAGRELAALVPEARFVALDGVAQNPWEEGPEEYLAEILAFLADEPVIDLRPATAQVGDRPVAIAFTDLVASTEKAFALGDEAYRQLVRDHDAVVRVALRTHGGREVKQTGDGILAVLPSAAASLRFALAVQAALGEDVRVGVNVGEPAAAETGHDVWGGAVNLAARACAAAQPGQVLVTAVVRDLAAGKGFDLVPVGPVELRGVPGPVPLFAVAGTAPAP
jgi:pimeloyl-ACP methyl ester carboxylesterase